MNKEIKKEWVEALRSGKYEQTTGELKDSEGFCCLGVLCDLHRKAKKKKGWIKPLDAKANFGYAYIDKRLDKGHVFGTLPPVVMKWAGLDEEDPEMDSGATLATLNDGGMGFPAISNLIEESRL